MSFIQCTVRTVQGVRVSEWSFYLGWGTFCNLRAQTKTKCRIIEPQPHRVHDLFDHLEKNFIMSGILVSQLVFHLKRDSVNQSVQRNLWNVNLSNIQHEHVNEWFEFLRQIPFVNIAIVYNVVFLCLEPNIVFILINAFCNKKLMYLLFNGF